jgi:hypothetical protein
LNPEQLQEHVDSPPALSKLRNQLQSEIGFRTDNAIEFGPLLIISIISICIQVLQYCREKRSTAEVRADMRDLKSLPPRKLTRLRRRLNVLWRDKYG